MILSTLDRRTFIGTRSTDGLWLGTQDRAYILTTVAEYTVAGAKDILVKDFHTQWNIQLDGGGSTQFFAGYDLFHAGYYLDSTDCTRILVCRAVGDILLVYEAGGGG